LKTISSKIEDDLPAKIKTSKRKEDNIKKNKKWKMTSGRKEKMEDDLKEWKTTGKKWKMN
jgi:hypothetical protein